MYEKTLLSATPESDSTAVHTQPRSEFSRLSTQQSGGCTVSLGEGPAPKAEVHVHPCKFPPCWSLSVLGISPRHLQFENFIDFAVNLCPGY